jgi:hypothetical protein
MDRRFDKPGCNSESWYEATVRMATVMVKLGYFTQDELRQLYKDLCGICAMDADLELLSIMIDRLEQEGKT